MSSTADASQIGGRELEFRNGSQPVRNQERVKHAAHSINHRVIVVGLVWNRVGELLFCRMAPDRGVFPGKWGFPGGGIEQSEKMEEALK